MTTRSALLFLLVTAAAGGWGCGASRAQIPPGTTDADKFLFTRGQEEFKDKNWIKAREYYRQIVDNYPQSTFRPDAKLAVGDSYIGEHSTESLLMTSLAQTRAPEFVTRRRREN
jgi:outer membrane protein assembly factor BamD (BamD/ComL family)